MRFRDYPQWPVVRRGTIQVNAQGDDALQGATWGVRVENPLLHRPWSPIVERNFTFERQSRVLMPRNKPIRKARFFKQGSPISDCGTPQHFASAREQSRVRGQRANVRM